MYKMNKKNLLLMLPAASAAVIFVAILVFIVPTLPGRLDEVLLTNDEICLGDVSSWHMILFGFNDKESNNHSGGKIHIDYGDYIHNIDFDNVSKGSSAVNKGNRSKQFSIVAIWERIIDYALWRIALHYFESSREDNHNKCDDGSIPRSSLKIHPLCGKYRQFRSRLRKVQVLNHLFYRIIFFSCFLILLVVSFLQVSKLSDPVELVLSVYFSS